MNARSRKSASESIYLFVPRRLREIDVLVAQLELDLNALRAERTVIENLLPSDVDGESESRKRGAGSKESGVVESKPSAITSGDSGKGKSKGSEASGMLTIKEMALRVLKENPEGLSNSGIGSQIKTRFGKDVGRTSLSPQLQRLGKDGAIEKRGDVWILGEVEA